MNLNGMREAVSTKILQNSLGNVDDYDISVSKESHHDPVTDDIVKVETFSDKNIKMETFNESSRSNENVSSAIPHKQSTNTTENLNHGVVNDVQCKTEVEGDQTTDGGFTTSKKEKSTPESLPSTIEGDAVSKKVNKVLNGAGIAEKEVLNSTKSTGSQKRSVDEIQNSDNVVDAGDVKSINPRAENGTVKLPKRKKFKITDRSESQGRSSNDEIKTPPTSPLNEGMENSRRTRSLDPNFAEKQKKFLAMVSSSLWNEDESQGAIIVESEKSENEDSNDIIVDAPSPSNESKEKKIDVKSNGKPLMARRGRPTKEMMRRRQAKILRRKSARFGEFKAYLEKDTSKIHEEMDKPKRIKDGKDRFCWTCHLAREHHKSINCETCPRAFHIRCIRSQCDTTESNNWLCPECTTSVKMENFENQSETMKLISADEFCSLLTKTVEFLKSLQGAEVFREPVDTTAFPDYRDYIVNPVNLKKIQYNIDKKLYGSTESFLADVKWIHHNSIIYNGVNSPLTTVSKSILVRCKSKMNQLERCVDCFKKSFDVNIAESFLEACRQPHLLVWAKFKGYPFWPSKVFHWKMDTKNNCIVEVKFFNDYSRAWVPSKSIYLFSKKSPTDVNLPNIKDQKSYQNALVEVQKHINNLEYRFGTFVYASSKTEFNPENYSECLKLMLPQYDPQKLQAKNTVIKSGNLNPSVTMRNLDQEVKYESKKLVGPKSFKEKKLKRPRVKRRERDPSCDADNDSASCSDEKLKKSKIIIEQLNNGLINKRNVKLADDIAQEGSTDPELSQDISSSFKTARKDQKLELSAQKLMQRLQGKVVGLRSNDSTVFSSKELRLDVQKSEDNNLRISFGDDASSTSKTSSANRRSLENFLGTVKREQFIGTNQEFPNDYIARGKQIRELVSGSKNYTPSESVSDCIPSEPVSEESDEEISASQLQTLLRRELNKTNQNDSSVSAKTLNPTNRKKYLSGINDANPLKTTYSELDEQTNFNSLIERPIGMETEARSLRLNPTSFDHEGNATRLFNFSVQQLVPLVADSLGGMLSKLANAGNKDALIQNLRLQLESINQKHSQEISSLRHLMKQQLLEYAHTSDILFKQIEERWGKKVTELEELLQKEKDDFKAEKERWRSEMKSLTASQGQSEGLSVKQDCKEEISESAISQNS